MVEIFYKTYYYIFNIFFDYYCIYLLHRNYSFEAVLWKTKKKMLWNGCCKATGVFIILRVLTEASHRHWRKAGISEKR